MWTKSDALWCATEQDVLTIKDKLRRVLSYNLYCEVTDVLETISERVKQFAEGKETPLPVTSVSFRKRDYPGIAISALNKAIVELEGDPLLRVVLERMKE